MNESWLSDESRLKGRADWVATPSSPLEMAKEIKEAHERGLSVSIQGARTGLAGGSVPFGGLALSTGRMNAILGLEAGNASFFLKAQSGIPLKDAKQFLMRPCGLGKNLQVLEAVRENHMGFAPNPSEKTATLGGLFASGARGLNSISCGSMSDNVSGVTWILPDGRQISAVRGEHVFGADGLKLPNGLSIPRVNGKDPLFSQFPAPGMDLIDFLAGSEGRLGVAAEITLRLQKIPDITWSAAYFFPSSDEALAFAAELRRWRGMLHACEIMDEAAVRILDEGRLRLPSLAALPPFPNAAAVYAEIAGDDSDALEEALFEQLELFSRMGGREEDTWAGSAPNEIEKFQSLHHSLMELGNTLSVSGGTGEAQVCRISSDNFYGSASVEKAWKICRLNLKESGIKGFVHGSVLDGRFSVCLLPTLNQLSGAEEFRIILARFALESGGAACSDYGVGKVNRKLAKNFLRPEMEECFKPFDKGRRMSNSFFLEAPE
jgi:D-lactate dehydrogenase (cytochrome)